MFYKIAFLFIRKEKCDFISNESGESIEYYYDKLQEHPINCFVAKS